MRLLHKLEHITLRKIFEDFFFDLSEQYPLRILQVRDGEKRPKRFGAKALSALPLATSVPVLAESLHEALADCFVAPCVKDHCGYSPHVSPRTPSKILCRVICSNLWRSL